MILRAMLAVAYATCRASHARQVKGDDPDKKGNPGPPGWGFGVGLTTPARGGGNLFFTKVEQRKKLDRLNDDGWKKTRYTKERMETGSRKRSSSAGSEKMERVGGK